MKLNYLAENIHFEIEQQDIDLDMVIEPFHKVDSVVPMGKFEEGMLEYFAIT